MVRQRLRITICHEGFAEAIARYEEAKYMLSLVGKIQLQCSEVKQMLVRTTS